MTTRWRAWSLVALLCAGLLVAGYVLVGGRTHPVHWDLRNSHRATDLGVKLNPHSGHDFDDPGPVDIDLAGGQRFHADKMMLIVAVTRDDAENVDSLVGWYPGLALDDAYQKAMTLARQFGLQTERLTDFRRRVLEDLKKGDRVRLGEEEDGSDVRLLSPEGPLFSLSLKYETVNDGQPVVLRVEIAWGENLASALAKQATRSATPPVP